MSLFWLLAYLALGYVLYRHRFPEGLFPAVCDPERERLQRTGRRRVLPLPARRDGGWR